MSLDMHLISNHAENVGNLIKENFMKKVENQKTDNFEKNNPGFRTC